MKSLKQTAKVAIGGLSAALSVVLLFLTSIAPYMTYAIPAAASLLIVIIVIEIDKKWALGVYTVVSMLALLLLPDKEAAVLYVMLFGCYPILKQIFESKLPRPVSWVLKFVFFNAAVLSAYAIITFVFKIPFDETGEFGKASLLGLLLAGNATFWLYDIALTRLLTAYLRRWRKVFHQIFKF